MIKIATLRAAGLSDTEILRVLEADQNERNAGRREQNRINQQNHRARQHVSADRADSADATLFLSSSLKSTSLRKEREVDTRATPGFDQFWAAYPHKVAKIAAAKAFTKARKIASLETIMAALARYAAKTDDRYWANPATWLNGGRWDDQPLADPQAPKPQLPNLNHLPPWEREGVTKEAYWERKRAESEPPGTQVRREARLGQNGAHYGKEL